MKITKSLGLLVVVLVILLGAPLLLNVSRPTCSLDGVNAQDNPCLAQDATISAMNVALLQATLNSRDYQLTSTALQNTINVLSANTTPIVRLTTFVVVVTATPNPNEMPMVVYQVVTATPHTPDVSSSATIDPFSINTNLPDGCILHTLQTGEFPSSLAVTYGVSFLDIMAVNNLTEDDVRLLQVGSVLVIPLENCPIEAFINTLPTITLPPTAVNLETLVQIVEVKDINDINYEQVVIRNDGNAVDMTGWTLSDGQGNVYTFPNGRFLFSGASITINTRIGADTPIFFFWGRDLPVFESGDVVVLKNREGEVVSSLQLP